MCEIPECLTDGAISTVADRGCIRIMLGRIDGRPFSGLIVDTRSGKHLHLPWADVRELTGLRVR